MPFFYSFQNGGTLQPLGWRFDSPRTNIHVVPKKRRFVPVSDDYEDSGDDADGDGEGRFVPVSDDNEDSGDDVDGDGEGRFVPVSDDDEDGDR